MRFRDGVELISPDSHEPPTAFWAYPRVAVQLGFLEFQAPHPQATGDSRGYKGRGYGLGRTAPFKRFGIFLEVEISEKLLRENLRAARIFIQATQSIWRKVAHRKIPQPQ